MTTHYVFEDSDGDRLESAGHMERATSLRSPMIIGLSAIVLSIGGLVYWSSAATIASAIIVPGVVVVDSGRKSIQHQDGGLVKSIDVVDGQEVSAGQSLIHLDGSGLKSASVTLKSLLAMNTVQRLRLQAERTGASTINIPRGNLGVGELLFSKICAQENDLFLSRRASLEDKVRTLQNDGLQALKYTASIDLQLATQHTRVDLTMQELRTAELLLRTGDGTRQHVLELARSIAELSQGMAELVARSNDGKSRLVTSRLEVERSRAAFIESVNTDLQQAERSRLDLIDKLGAIEDRISHLNIVSPVEGNIVNLAVHTVGGVVGGGAVLLEVVPKADHLELEGNVRPEDVDNIRPGLSVGVALTGFIGQQLPRLVGSVKRVSADRVSRFPDETAFFRVRVDVPPGELIKLGSHELRPGMAVTLMIKTGEQAPLEYLTAPLLRFFSETWRA